MGQVGRNRGRDDVSTEGITEQHYKGGKEWKRGRQGGRKRKETRKTGRKGKSGSQSSREEARVASWLAGN